MEAEKKRQMLTHIAAASVGGFFGGYTILNFFELFANAQTSNMIHLVSNLVEGNFGNFVYIFISLFTYMAGNAFAALFIKYSGVNLRTVSLIIDAIAVIVVGVVVSFTNISSALLPIVFAMPVQWNAFVGDAGYASSTIFSTNNLRQATMSLVFYFTDKDKAMLEKAKFFWLTLLFYHLGVAGVCVASMFFGVLSIWFCFVPICFAAVVYIWQLKMAEKN